MGTTASKRRTALEGFVVRIEKEHLPKHVVFGEIKDVANFTVFIGQQKTKSGGEGGVTEHCTEG